MSFGNSDYGLLLDDDHAVRTLIDDAHRDLLQIAVLIDRELSEMCLDSPIKDTDNRPERADVSRCARSRGDDFRVEYEVCATHDVSRDAVARRVARIQILTDKRQPAGRVLRPRTDERGQLAALYQPNLVGMCDGHVSGAAPSRKTERRIAARGKRHFDGRARNGAGLKLDDFNGVAFLGDQELITHNPDLRR